MKTKPARPSWVVRQRNARIFVQAPNPEVAIETAARRIGPMGGWHVGPDVVHEAFAREECPERARAGGYTRSVIKAPGRQSSSSR